MKTLPLLHLHRTITLVLLLGTRVLAADGGVDAGSTLVDFSDPLYMQCEEAPPSITLPDGSSLLPKKRAERVACIMATCEVDRENKAKALEAAPPPSWWVAIIATAGAGIALGVALGRTLTSP